jgi:hypothetical protein
MTNTTATRTYVDIQYKVHTTATSTYVDIQYKVHTTATSTYVDIQYKVHTYICGHTVQSAHHGHMYICGHTVQSAHVHMWTYSTKCTPQLFRFYLFHFYYLLSVLTIGFNASNLRQSSPVTNGRKEICKQR